MSFPSFPDVFRNSLRAAFPSAESALRASQAMVQRIQFSAGPGSSSNWLVDNVRICQTADGFVIVERNVGR